MSNKRVEFLGFGRGAAPVKIIPSRRALVVLAVCLALAAPGGIFWGGSTRKSSAFRCWIARTVQPFC